MDVDKVLVVLARPRRNSRVGVGDLMGDGVAVDPGGLWREAGARGWQVIHGLPTGTVENGWITGRGVRSG